MFVGWNYVQPTRGTWNWDMHDRQYNAARAAGLQPLIVAVAAPCWANPADVCDGGSYVVPDAAHEADWAEFTGGWHSGIAARSASRSGTSRT